jgi:hypothetical protein
MLRKVRSQRGLEFGILEMLGSKDLGYIAKFQITQICRSISIGTKLITVARKNSLAFSYDLANPAPAKIMQIQTELDSDRTKKLTFIQQQTHQDTKEIIEAAIDIYYQNLQPSAYDILMQNGFIGCGSGDPDLSTNYKTLLQQDLELKHDHS